MHAETPTDGGELTTVTEASGLVGDHLVDRSRNRVADLEIARDVREGSKPFRAASTRPSGQRDRHPGPGRRGGARPSARLQHACTFARDTLATEGELLDIQYQFGSDGLQEEAARVGTEFVHKLAKVTESTLADVGEIAATTYNTSPRAWRGAVADKLSRIGNVLARTQIRYQIENFGQLG